MSNKTAHFCGALIQVITENEKVNKGYINKNWCSV